jgi:hypothetical protein
MFWSFGSDFDSKDLTVSLPRNRRVAPTNWSVDESVVVEHLGASFAVRDSVPQLLFN